MIRFRQALTACASAALFIIMSGGASAAIMTANTASCGGGDETCDDSAFLAAIGGGPTDVFLDFATDKNGDPSGDNVSAVPVSGDLFSDDVTFASRASAIFGGADSPNVFLFGGGSVAAQIGTLGDEGGILDIIFSSGVSAVGFGTIEFGTADSISVFDTDDVLLAMFSGLTGGVDYIGIIATMGELIGRVSLEGNRFTIQNIQFNFADGEIPLPAGLLLFPAGLAALGLASRRRRKAAA